ncbi:MAG: hypothetical protein OXK80_05995 [Bdellovibrionales bacterium]|nr:hypothetical protein [Bdellovibrionales bacterium]
MKKWIFIIALFTSPHAFGWLPAYTPGYYQTVCDYYYGCRTVYNGPYPMNIFTPALPMWFNAQARLFGACAYQHQICLWNAYHPSVCTHNYYVCMGYVPY